MNKYGLYVKLTAKDGNGDKLADFLLEAASMLSTAKGCQVYAVSKDNSDTNIVWITEVWDSEEDHDNSLNTPGVRELIGQVMPILDGKPEKVHEMTVLGGVGVK